MIGRRKGWTAFGWSSTALWLTVAAIVLIAAVASAVWLVASPKPALVMLASPSYEDLESSVSSSGRVVPEHEFIARASFPGLIEAIDVHLGEAVQPGQVLVRMKDPFAGTRVATAAAALQVTEAADENMQRGGSQEERLTLRTDLDRAQAEAEASEGYLATMRHLQESGAASEAEVRAAMHRSDAAAETLHFIKDRIAHRYSARDVGSWHARVNEAHSSLASAKAAFANTNITSTVAGVVYLIPITANDFVSTGVELLRVADLQRLEVHSNFDEADMGKLHDGAAVLINWEGKPGRTWHGIIKHAPFAAVMSGVRSVGECIITILDVKSDLPPNTIVTATVVDQRRHHVLSLPREALRTAGTTSFVYRLSKGVLVQTPVEVGLMNLDHFEVLHGIGPADQVALHAMDNREFFNGMQVRVRP